MYLMKGMSVYLSAMIVPYLCLDIKKKTLYNLVVIEKLLYIG